MTTQPVTEPMTKPTKPLPHISVCICTFKRTHLLGRLLQEISLQETNALFTFSIVVVDNDAQQSARGVVKHFAAGAPIPVRYAVEPRQNIALARNQAVANATGDFIAFIDDDEFPIRRWLLTLFNACHKYGVDGALGPVKPHFDDPPPKWLVKGRFYDRPSYPTGLVIDWKKGRTGNVLLKKEVFVHEKQPFRPDFLSGEDQDFFRRVIEKGHVFVWCHEALAYEVVPPIRWKRTFMMKRALLRGANSKLHPSFGPAEIAKSLVAVPAYAVALPFAFVLGQDKLMSAAIRLCDHLGRLFAFIGVKLVREPYVTE